MLTGFPFTSDRSGRGLVGLPPDPTAFGKGPLCLSPKKLHLILPPFWIKLD
jgi:hypothetical protein